MSEELPDRLAENPTEADSIAHIPHRGVFGNNCRILFGCHSWGWGRVGKDSFGEAKRHNISMLGNC